MAPCHRSYVSLAGGGAPAKDLPANLQSPDIEKAFGLKSGAYFAACGSPNEVANNPALGHRYYFAHSPAGEEVNYDQNTDNFDHGCYNRPHDSKQTTARVWFMHAVYAKDQLRQRAAWALAQTFVMSSHARWPRNAEIYLNYYDIFLRNAFGNFRDVLREVTYNPMMAEYLTYHLNRCRDLSLRYADENYAREIMQLFTIGLWELTEDGRKKVDAQNQPIPTYSNANIMDFARVFTGFRSRPQRANYEENKNNKNPYDPMSMWMHLKDIYPKRDLNGGYLGDGYPLCDDLPQDHFLHKGAVYVYAGGRPIDGALVLGANSELRRALCGGAEPCDHALKRKLTSNLQCRGSECSAEWPKAVQVDSVFYNYTAPACVFFFFKDGNQVEVDFSGNARSKWRKDKPWNEFTVAWQTGLPTEADCVSPCEKRREEEGGRTVTIACICPSRAPIQQVFNRQPSASEVETELKIGAYPPTTNPFWSGNGVKACCV